MGEGGGVGMGGGLGGGLGVGLGWRDGRIGRGMESVRRVGAGGVGWGYGRMRRVGRVCKLGCLVGCSIHLGELARLVRLVLHLGVGEG